MQDLQKVFEVLSSLNWEHHLALKTSIKEQYRKLITGYEALLNKTEAILYQLIKSNPICIMVKIQEILMIWQTWDLSWFNKSIINLSTYTKLIIKIFFFNNFRPFLTAIKNKIKQLLNKEGLKHEFEHFFEKMYKIKAVATILGLFMLIHNNSSLDLT